MRRSRFSLRLAAARYRCRRTRRSGAILVWFGMLIVLLLGMVGLVVDAGLLMATHRQAQNAADAAALAAALDVLYGRGESQANATATTFVTSHNGLAGAPAPTVNIPPASGPYAGNPAFVEVIASAPMQTYFIHILGIARNQTVQARAVAGSEAVSSGEGVCVLDPTEWPGLSISGGGILRVHGSVVVNSEGEGVDEDGVPIDNGNQQTAASVTNNSTLEAEYMRVVGGVNNPDNFQNVDPYGPNPLHCRQMRMPDPLLFLPTPTTSNGVVDIDRGAPRATNVNLTLDDPSGENFIETVDVGGVEVNRMVLQPGIYTSITVTGGYVRFVPGIYVIRPDTNTQNVVQLTGGTILARGIMIYATGHNYSPDSGSPDDNDGDKAPPHGDGALFGDITINADMELTGIDFEEHDYSAFPVDPIYENMLFYQRRRNKSSLRVEGNAEDGYLGGTLYAKWAPVTISGHGTYDAQFVVGSMHVTGQGNVTLLYAGDNLGKAPQLFLVE